MGEVQYLSVRLVRLLEGAGRAGTGGGQEKSPTAANLMRF